LDGVIFATKCFNPMSRDPNQRGGSRRWIIRAAKDCLRRLGTDYIDLYQMHRHDWDTDLDETLGALTDLIRQGKVRYIGSSSFPADWIVEAHWAADRPNRERFVCEQPQYSIFARSAEGAVLPSCQRHRIGVIPWSRLAGGWLTGKYRRGEPPPEGSRYAGGGAFGRGGRGVENSPASEVRFDLVDRLTDVAKLAGLPITHLALGFVDAHPAITSTAPQPLISLEDPNGSSHHH
jgi:aryl-alcohol dehydrogenase (NADP+)